MEKLSHILYHQNETSQQSGVFNLSLCSRLRKESIICNNNVSVMFKRNSPERLILEGTLPVKRSRERYKVKVYYKRHGS